MTNVIWITGLSAAGKTTLGHLVANALRQRGLPTVLMDGDDLREALGATTNHSSSARLELAHKYSRLARLVALQGVNVIVSTVALIREIHIWNRQNLPGYFEVYLKVPMEELRRRDPKGIYRRYDQGIIHDVAGLDMKIDEPQSPDLVIEYTPGLDPMMELQQVMVRLFALQNKETSQANDADLTTMSPTAQNVNG
jgi:adenylylsulfate kinase-like enzyme